MAEGKTVSVNKTYAPNDFRVLMGSDDYSRFSQMESGLAKEFSELIIDAAKENRWNLMGLPKISFAEVEKMGKGEFKVEASLSADPDRGAPAMSTRDPEGGNLDNTRAISSDTAERLGVKSSGAQLLLLGPDGEEKESIAITKAPVVVGRLSTNDVVLADPNVSRRHAELRRDGEQWVLVDLGSTNGTLVNGKLAREHEIKDGDKLSFGTTEVIFKLGRK
jgi:predicted component of type VI protein secretion system